MTPAPPRPRLTWLTHVWKVLLTLWCVNSVLGFVQGLPAVQMWWAQRSGLPVYSSLGTTIFQPQVYEGLDVASRSPDGRWVAGGGSQEYGKSFTFRVILWNAATMERRWAVTRPTTDFRSVNALAWSPDSRALWAHDTEGKVTVLNVGTGRVVREFQADTYRPCVFAATPGGLLLTEQAESGSSPTLTLRRWEDGAVQWRVPLPCWDAAGGSVDAAGRTVAYSPRMGEVALFDLRRRAPLGAALSLGEKFGPYALALSPDGTRVAAGGGKGRVVVWSAASGQEVWRRRPHWGLVQALTWDETGSALASSGFGGCGGWRSECVVVTRSSSDEPQSRVVWWRRFQSAKSIEWLGEDRLLLSIGERAFTVRTPR